MQLFKLFMDDPGMLQLYPIEFPYSLAMDLIFAFMRDENLVFNIPLLTVYDDVLLQLHSAVRAQARLMHILYHHRPQHACLTYSIVNTNFS